MALNILVVDDSAIMRRMVARTLQMSGLRIGKLFFWTWVPTENCDTTRCSRFNRSCSARFEVG